jgi:hypothetical protein
MEAVAQIFAWLLLAALAILGYEGYVWARFGWWETITVEQVFFYAGVDRPIVSWVGVQQAIDWWLASGLSSNLFVASFLIPGLLVFLLQNRGWRTRK